VNEIAKVLKTWSEVIITLDPLPLLLNHKHSFIHTQAHSHTHIPSHTHLHSHTHKVNDQLRN